jgi:hypothetical protein
MTYSQGFELSFMQLFEMEDLMLLHVDKKTWDIRFTFLIMFLASLSVIIPLTVFNNLLLVFIIDSTAITQLET